MVIVVMIKTLFFKKPKLTQRLACVLYIWVLTPKQKKDLENQINILADFVNSNGFKVSEVYSDIESGIGDYFIWKKIKVFLKWLKK